MKKWYIYLSFAGIMFASLFSVNPELFNLDQVIKNLFQMSTIQESLTDPLIKIKCKELFTVGKNSPDKFEGLLQVYAPLYVPATDFISLIFSYNAWKVVDHLGLEQEKRKVLEAEMKMLPGYDSLREKYDKTFEEKLKTMDPMLYWKMYHHSIQEVSTKILNILNLQ
jgi:hypothetical protein